VKKFIPILAYHSFNPQCFSGKLALAPELFKKQMLFLKKKNFYVVGLDQCVENAWTENFWEQKAAITFDDGYLDNYHVAFPALKECAFPGTFFVTPEDVGSTGFMTWDMLGEMARMPGVEIGSHGLFHKALGDIPEDEAWKSISVSKKILEERLGREIKAFSYPSGSFNENIVEMVRRAGYVYACAASHVHDRKWEGNPFLLRRIKISSSSSSDFAFSLRLSGFYHSFGRP